MHYHGMHGQASDDRTAAVIRIAGLLPNYDYLTKR